MPRSFAQFLTVTVLTTFGPLCFALVLVLSHLPIAEGIHDSEHPETATQLPDFKAITQTKERKQAFVELMLPLVEARNTAILKSRTSLVKMQQALAEEKPLTTKQLALLERLRERYQVKTDPDVDMEKVLDTLLLRADIIPESMVLAQAAVESGWGTSRFAGEAQNLFGQWCYTEGCGLVPERRARNARHEVQTFATVEEAISSYFRNLNTHKAYTEFRRVRAQLRAEGEPISGSRLVATLEKYSSRGAAYTHELRRVIKANRFEQLTLSSINQDTLIR